MSAALNRVWITDVVEFAKLFSDHVANRYGNQTAAAEHLGTSQAMISRLCRGAQDTINTDLFQKLWKEVPDLMSHVMTSDEFTTTLQYGWWVNGVLRRVGRFTVWPLHVLYPVDLPEGSPEWREDRARAAERVRTWDLYRSEFEDVIRSIRAHNTYGPMIRSFEDWAAARGYTPARVEVAVCQVLGPFLDAVETDGVEPSWQAFDEIKKLELYLKYAIKAQKTLLGRAPGVSRVPPVAHLKWVNRPEPFKRIFGRLGPGR